MSDFKWKHYRGNIILGCVRWYCKYEISYRDLEEMMLERGIEVDHTTLYRWVQQYAPKLHKRLHWYNRFVFAESWRVDETYVKVKGKWKYLYRAITKSGATLDFYLSSTRNAKAVKRFLGKLLRRIKEYKRPKTINTDLAPFYNQAIKQLKEECLLEENVFHRKVKYLNNRLEADRGKLKRLIKPVLGFKSMKTAFATIKGFEVMRMLKKGQFDNWIGDRGLMGEIRFIESQFFY